MTWQSKLIGDEEERAVSPVIGVILMVAITVILAAVIAAFVMDIGPGGEPVQAALDVTDSEVTVTSAENVDGFEAGSAMSGCNSFSSGSLDTEVGSTWTHGCSSGDRLQIIGTTDGGGEEILVDEEF